MTDILLNNTTWDVVIQDGDLVVIPTKEEEARQSTLITLRTYRGEWFKNIVYGIPWLSNENNTIQLLGSKDKPLFDSYLKEGMLNSPEILSIISYESSVEAGSGVFTVKAVLQTEVGPITIDETI